MNFLTYDWWVTVETQVKCPSCGKNSPNLHTVEQMINWVKAHRKEHRNRP